MTLTINCINLLNWLALQDNNILLFNKKNIYFERIWDTLFEGQILAINNSMDIASNNSRERHTMEVNGDIQLFDYTLSSKDLLCSKYMFGMTWGWVIDAIFLFLGELFNVLYIELTINNLQSIYESGVTLNSNFLFHRQGSRLVPD